MFHNDVLAEQHFSNHLLVVWLNMDNGTYSALRIDTSMERRKWPPLLLISGLPMSELSEL